MNKKIIYKVFFVSVIIAVFSFSLFAQQNEIIRVDQSFITKTYDLKNGGSLNVENQAGSVRITGWNNDKIEINIRKRGRWDDFEVLVDKRGDRFYIELEYPDRDWDNRWYGRNNNTSVFLDINVPNRTRLDLHSLNGGIEVEKIDSFVEVDAVNGGVEIRDINGDVEGESANGSVEVYDVTGRVNAHSANGSVIVRNTGDVDANSGNGRVNVYSTNGSNVRANSGNGSVEVELERVDPRGRYDLSSGNGSVRIHIPRDAKADITARVKARRLHSDFDIFDEYDDRYSRSRRRSYYRYDDATRTFRGTLNGGGGRIHLSVSQGSVDIRKR